eukprot:TRINITY_DN3725_c0_g1_i1.p1 TRINITY_DN3725_c0_g1~~TRINITY_DN3725_c0_g1_i1.p1  ORF type:complete len:748 (+),score=114.11 TRINITY_DN3725_c0_g1_i1:109-2352(+)
MASEVIYGTPEVVEYHLNESHACRDSALAAFQSGLGPPDLVHFTKVHDRPSLPKFMRPKVQDAGYYHWVLGVDVSSPASMAAYFSELVSMHESASWYGSGQYRIKNGIYRTYNPFRNHDVRCEVSFPGSIKVDTVDSSGKIGEMCEAEWDEIGLSSMLRALDGPAVPRPALKSLPVFRSPEAEVAGLKLAQKLWDKASSLGWSDKSVRPNMAVNYMSKILVKHFLDTCRVEVGLNFFQPLLKSHPVMQIPIAWLLVGQKEHGPALERLILAIQALKPEEEFASEYRYSLLVEMADIYYQSCNYDQALQACNEALSLNTEGVRPYLIVAQCHVELGDYKHALFHLNRAKRFSRVLHNADVHHPPGRLTKPGKVEHSVSSKCSIMRDLLYPQEDPTPLPPNSIVKNLLADDVNDLFKAAYMVVTNSVKGKGWTESLKLRAEIFVMQSENAVPPTPVHQPSTPSKVPNPTQTTEAPGTDTPKESPKEAVTSESESTPKTESIPQEPTDVEATIEKELSPEAEPSTPPSNDTPTQPINDTPSEPSPKPSPTLDTSDLATPASKTHLTTPLEAKTLSVFDDGTEGGKVFCSQWLDQCFQAAFQDVRTFVHWQNVDEPYRNTQKRCDRTSHEWHLLANLATRMFEPDRAEDAWRAAVATSFYLPAWTALMTTIYKSGRLNDTLSCAHNFLKQVIDNYGPGRVPPCIPNALFAMVSHYGMAKVRDVQTKLHLGESPINSHLLDAIRWHVKGYDR